jgi:Fibronectin type III domain/Immunoglobulin I-set domain
VDLEFDPPADDGGAPIEEYVIEQRDPKTGQWVPVKTIPADKEDDAKAKKEKRKKKKVKAKIEGLKEGDNVQFRVRAKNQGGLGEPSDPTDMHKVRPKKMKPRIDRNAMKPLLLKSGKTHNFEVPVRGIPVPEYVWSIGDYIVETNELFSLDSNTPNVAKLNVLDAQRKKSGVLKLKATNEHGSDEYELEYTVLGAPSKPNINKKVDLVPADTKLKKGKGKGKGDGDKENEYPNLRGFERGGDDDGDDDDGSGKVKGKKKKPRTDLPIGTGSTSPLAAHVSWVAPEDDGGVPLQKYVIEARPEKGGKWEKVAEADPEDTAAIIKNLKPDEKYKFRVRAVNKNDEASEPSETDVCYVPPNVKAPGEAGKPEITDFDEKSVKLKFKPPRNDGGAPVTHYIIEAKDKNSPSGGWKEIAVTDSPKPEAEVEGLREGQTLQFRVRAVNDAGVGEPGDASEAHLVRAKNSPPQIIRDSLKKEIKSDLHSSLKIDIEFKGEPEPTVEFFLKPRKRKGKPEAPTETEYGNSFTVGTWHRNEPAADALQYSGFFTVDKMERNFSGELTIVVKNENGLDSEKISIRILGPPKSPRGPLEAVDVTKDSCVLKFKPPEDDGDCQPTSYQLEKMDTKTGLWVPCGKIAAPIDGDDDTEIKVPIKGLEEGKRYQFRVKAINDEGASDPLTTETSILAKDPFGVSTPPGFPTVVDFDGPMVELEFSPPSRDGGAPIQTYIIEKKAKGEDRWEKAAEVPSQGFGTQKAKVKGLQEGCQYQFRVKAVNKGGVSDPSEESSLHLARKKNGKLIFERHYFMSFKNTFLIKYFCSKTCQIFCLCVLYKICLLK